MDVARIWDTQNVRLLRFIQSKVSDRWDAEDILQDVFAKLLTNRDRLRDESKLESWLFRVARNSVIDYYRKQTYVPLDLQFDVSPAGQDAAPWEQDENRNGEVASWLQAVLPEVAPKYAEALVLHDIYGFKHREIAEHLNVSVSGSKTGVQRGRRQLKAALEQCCDFQLDSYGNIIDYQRRGHAQCQC